MDHQNNESKLDLFYLLEQLWRQLRSFWVLPLALILACSGLMTLRAWKTYQPLYTSSAMFLVTSGYSSDDILAYDYYYNNEAAQKLSDAFPYILSTDVMRERVMLELGTPVINGTITAKAVASTNLFSLSVQSSDPQDAYDILCAVIQCYPEVASYMVDYSQVVMKQYPTLPTEPTNSLDLVRPACIGALIGALLGLALLLLLTRLRKTIHNQDDLSKTTNLPVFASLPAIRLKRRRSGSTFLSILNPQTDSQFLEGIRHLRLKVLRNLDADKGCNIILITSTLPGEGKTTISANLALALADTGAKTLLIDGDLRKQDLHAVLPLQPRGPEEADSPVSLVEGSTLQVLNQDQMLSHADLLNPRTARGWLESLRPHFDYIIFDSSPCGLVSDVRFLCRYADCVVYSIRKDHAPRSQIRDCLDSLAAQNVKLAGVVFNGVQPKAKHHYGYGYGYGYGYKYKYGYGHSKSSDAKEAGGASS